jgi:protein-disulfide isomerase
MKRSLVIAGVLVILCAAGYFLTVFQNKLTPHEEANPFIQLAKSQPKQESSQPLQKKIDETLLTLGARKITLNELPRETQIELMRERLASYARETAILKDYAVRQYVKDKAEGNPIGLGSSENLPTLASLVSPQVDDQQVENIYNQNIKKLPTNHNPDYVKFQIRLELLTQKSFDFLKSNLQVIHAQTELIFKEPPALKMSWFSIKDIPFLGNDANPKKLFIFGNYQCQKCAQTDIEMGALLDKYGLNDFSLHYFPFTEKTTGTSYRLAKLALCINHFQPQIFWKWHVAMSQRASDFSTQDEKKADELAYNIAKENGVDNLNKIKQCQDDKKNTHEKTIEAIHEMMRILPENTLPIVLLNGTFLDLDGRNLILAVDQYFKKEE